MKLLILLLAALVASAFADSGEASKQKTRRGSCGGLVTEPPTTAAPSTASPAPTTVPTPPPGMCYCTPATDAAGSTAPSQFVSHCPLIEAFWNMTINLTVSQQVEWIDFIHKCENEILANVSLSNDEKVVLISLSLKAFFSIHVDIYNELSYMQIGDWGLVIDFMYVSIQIQIESVQSVVTLDGSGQCDVTSAIKNASEGCSAAEKSALLSLVAQIQVVLESGGSIQIQLSAVFELIQSFCTEHPDMELFLLSIEIEGFGSIQSFVDVCQTYWRINNVNEVLSGSSTSDCVLLEALLAASTNASFTSDQQAQIVQLYQKLQVQFKATITISGRLTLVSNTCYQMFLQMPWMIEIVESVMCGQWGSIYDIIFCSGICTNCGCCTLTEATTTAVPTTTIQPANCATIGSLITVTSSNTTVLTDCLLTVYANMNANTKSGFNSCFNKVRQAIWNNVNFPTQASKFTELHTDFTQYNANNLTAQGILFANVISSWRGTIGQFVTCCGSA